MKTKQEQIDKMAQAMCGFCTADKRCVLKYSALYSEVVPCSEVANQDCTCKESAEELLDAGYGDVSEYKNRFEVADKVLTETRAKLTKAEHDRDRYKAEIERLTHIIEYCENEELVKSKVKQAQIDVLNKVMTYLNNKIENDYGDMADSVHYLTVDMDDFDDFTDELIKEVEAE